ncbi:hypothetical protein CEP54_016263 [Fusarium duplospermum]|uniref:Uncharacterized protein n=1 Tax=Fusarium duplospermum TaxID=1325734 RepID=A0A428NG32_9HYPO|nr:hypothetical protein CEP54_016263 [Fusarium duplospermum]
MSNNPIQQNAPVGQHWVTLAQPKLATTQSRILELTGRMDKLRPGGHDIPCDEAVERLRENLADAKALFEAKGMASRIGAINLDEEVAQGQAMANSIFAYLVQRRPHATPLLRSFGDAYPPPPKLARAFENAEFSVPDSQPMSDVLWVENVPRLREENVALREQVEELQEELKARDDLLASAKDALEQQKAEFDNTELCLKESSAKDKQQRAEVQGQLEQSKSAIDGVFKKISRLDNELQAADVQCQTAKEDCQTAQAK